LTFKRKLIKIEDKYFIKLNLDIAKGWHAYAKLTKETEYFIATTIKFILPKGVKLVGKLNKPKTYPYADIKGVELYQNGNEFTQEISLNQKIMKGKKIKVIINYQLCDDYSCRAPDFKELELEIIN